MSFITDYHILTQKTKPDTAYHVWSMLSVLSAFAGRRFWFPFGHLNYYPNLYVVLVGDPAAGKSTAMNMAKEIVRASGVTPLAATQITKEALGMKMSAEKYEGKKFFTHDKKIHEYNQMAIFATELVEFIAVNPQGFLDFLTTVWDESVWEVETKNKGHDYVTGPYVTVLACMTPEKLKGFMKLSILTGGFARRTAFMFCANYNIIAWPSRTQAQIEASQRLISFGVALQKRSGPFGITPECAAFYEAWNLQNEKTIRERHHNVRGWYASKGEMLFKLSMLIALAENPENAPLEIDVPHYKIALKFCEMLEETLPRVFEGTGINPNANAIAQVVRMLEALDRPMNRKHLELMFLDNFTSFHELKDTMNQLVSVGRLAERTLSSNGILLGSVIATPATIARYSDVELAGFLVRSSAPPMTSYTDSPEEASPSKSQSSPPEDRTVEESQLADPQSTSPDVSPSSEAPSQESLEGLPPKPHEPEGPTEPSEPQS